MTNGGTRRALVAGNWKLHKTLSEAVGFARSLRSALAGALAVDVAVAPAFTALRAVADALEGSPIRVAAQDAFWEDHGAFTGEVSAPLLKDAGCTLGIVGHSERRQFFGETDESVARKVRALFAHGVVPIACVGESLAEREAGKTLDVVLRQTRAIAGAVAREDARALVLAYEPVWAIGTGRTASPGDAQEVHAAIRGELRASLGAEAADRMRILYGGSVKPENTAALLAGADVDGALVGGASLQVESFAAIIRAAH